MFASWLPLALFALIVWSIQRVVTKLALIRWSTARFYRLNALLSLGVYAVFAITVPPDPGGVVGAVGLSLLMAMTFWVTTEATRRGPVGVVAPLTAMSPALTVILAVAILGERISFEQGFGISAASRGACSYRFGRGLRRLSPAGCPWRSHRSFCRVSAHSSRKSWSPQADRQTSLCSARQFS